MDWMVYIHSRVPIFWRRIAEVSDQLNVEMQANSSQGFTRKTLRLHALHSNNMIYFYISIYLIISEIWSQVPLHSAKVTDKTISSHVISPRKLQLLYHIPLGDLSKQGVHLFYAFDCYKLSLQQASFVGRRHWLLLHAWKENTSGDDSKDRAHTWVTWKGHLQAADFTSDIYLCKYLYIS